MVYHSLAEMKELAESQNVPMWRVVMEKDRKERLVTEEETFETMRGMYRAMRQADASYDGNLHSASGLSGGDGRKLQAYRLSGNSLMGEFPALVMEKAVKMGESNACMKRIVAAPTAGSCGVIPAVLLSYEKLYAQPEEKMVEALFLSAGVGEVIAENASIAGAAGGCQAEIGSASAMAAAALVYLRGGDNDSILHAAAFALKNMLGLACDPVCGLVEVPCIKRNAAGAVNAITAAELALSGIRSAIPADEVIDAMRRIGNDLPRSLKETGEGGLAATETGKILFAQFREQNEK